MLSLGFFTALLALSPAQAEGPVRGTIKKVDVEKGTITLTWFLGH